MLTFHGLYDNINFLKAIIFLSNQSNWSLLTHSLFHIFTNSELSSFNILLFHHCLLFINLIPPFPSLTKVIWFTDNLHSPRDMNLSLQLVFHTLHDLFQEHLFFPALLSMQSLLSPAPRQTPKWVLTLTPFIILAHFLPVIYIPHKNSSKFALISLHLSNDISFYFTVKMIFII